jgi:hypothetical protein
VVQFSGGRSEKQIEELKARREFTEDHGYHRDVPSEDGYEVEEVWETRTVGASWARLTDNQRIDQIVDNTSINHLAYEDRVSILRNEVRFERLDEYRQRQFYKTREDFARDAALDVYDPSQYARSSPPQDKDRGRSR